MVGTKVALAVLSVATGSLDVTAFLRLGGVFASIMTSNLIFVSLAVVKADATLGRHCAAALAGYIAGVGVGSTVAPPAGGENHLGTGRLALVLTAETLLLAGSAAWWVIEGGRPEGWQQLTLLGAVTFAMGLQSAAVRQLGDPDANTTYMTGTLTGMVVTAITGRRPDAGAAIAVAGLLAGAAIGVGLLETVPDITPFPAVVCLALTAGLSSGRSGYGLAREGARKHPA